MVEIQKKYAERRNFTTDLTADCWTAIPRVRDGANMAESTKLSALTRGISKFDGNPIKYEEEWKRP